MAESAGEKSQDPTPHRRQKAREQGQTARSQDLVQAAVLLAGVLGIMYLGGEYVRWQAGWTGRQLGGDAWLTADREQLLRQANHIAWGLAPLLLPLFGLLMAVGAGLHVAQSGLLFLPDKLLPDWSRVSPLQGWQRIFSLAGAMRLTFGVFKTAIILLVAWLSLYGERERVLALAGLALPQIALFLTEILLWTALKIAVALVVLALLDYGFQWWKNEQDLRMTTQEIREEMKELQGDPQLLQRRRAAQRQMLVSQLAPAVKKADFVATNPTELAVAVQYDPETMAAPIVVAKGAGVLAQRIRRLALENGIPIIERKPLAQALYRQVDVNKPIPLELYSAVAEILRYVYQLKGKTLPQIARR